MSLHLGLGDVMDNAPPPQFETTVSGGAALGEEQAAIGGGAAMGWGMATLFLVVIVVGVLWWAGMIEFENGEAPATGETKQPLPFWEIMLYIVGAVLCVVIFLGLAGFYLDKLAVSRIDQRYYA